MESKEYLTIEEVDFMKHSLGLTNEKYSYRNFYVGQSETGDSLTNKGFARRRCFNGMINPYYHITEKGIEILKKYIGNFKSR